MRPIIISVSATLALLPSMAFAHPGHDETATFMQGLLHPLSSADHLLAMLMVGLFAVQLGGRALWLLPSTFLAAMVAGSLAGVSSIASSATEIGIVLSAVALGAIVAFRIRTKLTVAVPLVAAAALLHGYAHGAEAHGALSLDYVGGFLLGTAGLLGAGMLAGRSIALIALHITRGRLTTR